LTASRSSWRNRVTRQLAERVSNEYAPRVSTAHLHCWLWSSRLPRAGQVCSRGGRGEQFDKGGLPVINRKVSSATQMLGAGGTFADQCERKALASGYSVVFCAPSRRSAAVRHVRGPV
jgi:hypothetical protein